MILIMHYSKYITSFVSVSNPHKFRIHPFKQMPFRALVLLPIRFVLIYIFIYFLIYCDNDISYFIILYWYIVMSSSHHGCVWCALSYPKSTMLCFGDFALTHHHVAMLICWHVVTLTCRHVVMLRCCSRVMLSCWEDPQRVPELVPCFLLVGVLSCLHTHTHTWVDVSVICRSVWCTCAVL